MATTPSTLAVALRPRAFLRVAGPDAEEFLQRLVSNDVAALSTGDACDALLLTPKARVIAPLRILRRGADDFLVLTEPELGDRVEAQLARFRLASKVEIVREEHESVVLLGEGLEAPPDAAAIPTSDYGVPAIEVLDVAPPPGADEVDAEALELLRIEALTPAYGREIDDRVLPAEAGLVERAVSLSKGCFPGQEPIARLHYRGHANRALRLLELDAAEPPPYDAEIRHGERAVGRVTSAARDRPGRVRALGYVRVDVPREAELDVLGSPARILR